MSEDSMKRLYIEPTARCNLQCSMCFRNSWRDEAIGDMSMETFQRAMDTMPASVETVFFGGMGEPLAHAHILDMVREAKARGKSVELLSNGTLLTQERSAALLDAGLDMLWLSIDSLEEGSYERIRQNSKFTLVKRHIEEFNRLRIRLKRKVRLGLAFVAMKSNAHELAKLPYFATWHMVNEVNVSNVIPTDEHTAAEMLCDHVVDWGLGDDAPMDTSPQIHLPLMNWDHPGAREGLSGMLSNSMCSVYLSGKKVLRESRSCRFINEGHCFVKFDGEVSPCMPLLRNGVVHLRGKTRLIHRHSYGNVRDMRLDDIWNSEEYAGLRRRVKNFEFSYCFRCSLCEYWEEGLTDCFGSPAPACGGCLWSEGVISCP